MLKKVIFTGFIFLSFGLCNGWAAGDSSGYKLSLFPPFETPKTEFVKGVDLGLVATKTNKVEGLQFSFIYSRVVEKSVGVQVGFIVAKSEDFVGAKWGFVSLSENVTGYNSGFVSFAKDFVGYHAGGVTKNSSIKGLQTGFVNISDNVTGVQFGFVNYAKEMNGVQIGLLNIIKNSKLPVMVFVNAKFK